MENILNKNKANYCTSHHIFKSESMNEKEASAENKNRFIGHYNDTGATHRKIGAPKLQVYAKLYNLSI